MRLFDMFGGFDREPTFLCSDDFSGSVEAVAGGGASSQGNTGGNNVGGSGANSSGNNGDTISAGAPGSLSMSNMAFTGQDALAIGALAATGILGYTGLTGTAGAITSVAAALGYSTGSNPGSALLDMAHDMSIGLGIAVAANPSFAMYSTTSEAQQAASSQPGGMVEDTGITGSIAVAVAGNGQLFALHPMDPYGAFASSGGNG